MAGDAVACRLVAGLVAEFVDGGVGASAAGFGGAVAGVGGGCQFNLLVQNGQVVGTEPLNGITNQSELCLKGMSGYDFINDTKILTPRVLHPMIRRTKGADLERVSWDEALDFTASKMQAIIDEYGPNAVMTTGSSRGGGNEANYVMQKFTRACIGTHSVDNCART